MSLAYWSVLFVGLMPYLLTGIAKFGATGFDNREPRPFMDTQSGWRKRAYWAHQNAFEAFPLFAVAVIVAQLKGSRPVSIDLACAMFVFFRVAYALSYLTDRATMRSLTWVGGIGCVLALFTLAPA